MRESLSSSEPPLPPIGLNLIFLSPAVRAAETVALEADWRNAGADGSLNVSDGGISIKPASSLATFVFRNTFLDGGGYTAGSVRTESDRIRSLAFSARSEKVPHSVGKASPMWKHPPVRQTKAME